MRSSQQTMVTGKKYRFLPWQRLFIFLWLGGSCAALRSLGVTNLNLSSKGY